MSEVNDAIDVLKRVYPATSDGQAHLHTVILDGIERYGLAQCLSPSFVIFLAKTAHMPVAEIQPVRPRPQLQLLQGGRNG
jgi:hypothetical protein